MPSTNPRALDFYRRGSEYFRRSNNRLEDLPYALQLYERATAEDPEFALAWARLGVAHTGLYFYAIDRTPARLELAEKAIQKAFDLVPDLPEAHLARANYLNRGPGKYDEALAEFDLAEKFIRNDPDLYFFRASVHRRLGDWERSIKDHDRALELDPLNVVYLRQQHVNYLNVRDYARAEQYLDRVLEIAPDDATTYVDKAFLALFRDGDTALANEYARSPPTRRYTEGLGHSYMRWLAAIYDRDYSAALGILDGVTGDSVRTYSAIVPKALLYARTHRLAGNAEQAQAHFQLVAEQIRRQSAGAAEEYLDANALELAEAEAGLGLNQPALESVARARDSLPQSRFSDPVRGARLPIDAALGILLLTGDQDKALDELRCVSQLVRRSLVYRRPVTRSAPRSVARKSAFRRALGETPAAVNPASSLRARARPATSTGRPTSLLPRAGRLRPA